MNRPYFRIFLVILLPLVIFFSICIPVKTEFTSISVSELYESTNSRLAAAGAALTSYTNRKTDFPVQYQTAYIAENTYLFGKAETMYIIPYLTAEVDDVRTAGKSDWIFHLYLSAFVQNQSGAIRESKSYRIKDSFFDVESDSNTSIMNRQLASTHDNRFSVSLDGAAWKPTEPYTIVLHASTQDSTTAQNAPCTAIYQWSGSISAWPIALFNDPIVFSVNACSSYQNNML